MKQPFMKFPGALRILSLLMALVLLAGCGAPAQTPQITTAPTTQGTISTEPTVDPNLPPQQDPHDEPIAPTTSPQPTTAPVTQPPIPTLPPVTEPVTTQPPITQPVTLLPTEPVTTPPATTQPVQQPSGSNFTVHFIDVGQADAALILCDGEAMLIDGGNADDSNLMYTYISRLGITELDYVIGTHAHEDHIGGIAGALNYASVLRVLCPVTGYSTKAFNNFVKAVQRHGQSITIPSVGDRFSLGSASCRVLAVNSSDDTNESSIVLHITYGSTSFLFTGDAEQEAENMMLSRSYDLKSDVLKVGHHGSASSTGYRFLREVDPDYAVISVGKDNSYGHPTETVLSRLRDADVTTFRTDLQGDIICTSDGRTVSFQVSRNQNTDTLGGIGNNSTQGGSASGTYVLNTNSMKFHDPDCSSAKKISAKNRKSYTGSREDLLDQGYTPCGYCDP
jgi:competence protein ComEC